jgi:hypothetical protein
MTSSLGGPDRVPRDTGSGAKAAIKTCHASGGQELVRVLAQRDKRARAHAYALLSRASIPKRSKSSLKSAPRLSNSLADASSSIKGTCSLFVAKRDPRTRIERRVAKP